MVGAPQIILIFAVMLLMFGGKNPRIMNGFGEVSKDFKNATKDIEKTQNKLSE